MFAFLVLVAFAFFITGMIKPEILKWHEKPTRVKVYLYSMVLFMLAMVFLPNVQQVKEAGDTRSEVKESVMSNIKAYNIIKVEDTSFPGRSRFSIYIISPESKTFEERGATALKAAMDFCKEKNANFVSAILEADKRIAYKGRAIAIADYSPDKGGVSGEEDMEYPWHVEAMKDDIDETSLKAAILWETNKPKFMHGYDLDEQGLSKLVAKKLGKKDFLTLFPSRVKLNIETI